ncbi:flagellar protein FliO/FliZ [Cryobacterium psychrotolerans]|uniref:Flagellar protein n=1 Tax=Cryobacterium psychrotolerans TaxID=386301 RepID=A0A1G8YBV6_9MICO|nr:MULTISPECIES: flagellar biosynthetic protein FliO [Cryobacterium]TFD49185.1 flagellar biosynthetic protein FliO [Cryobacterium sp. TMT1-2-1]TFD90933.1 flagellar biosynthetic protein FliO [Cryobacterium psychrotolerans]SDK00389.1 flagellar protein FliO/FliZ [Cryobacterium psychrotolerans]
MDTLLVGLRVVLSLAVVLGLLWVMQRRLSRGGRARGASNLVSVVGRQSLGSKASVVVVEIDGRRLILGVTEAQVTVLQGGGGVGDRAETFAQSMSVAEGTDLAGTDLAGTDLAGSDLSGGDTAPEPPLEFRPRRKSGQAGRLGGSILSPATWQQTAAVLRQER